jgi:hypothetical protein
MAPGKKRKKPAAKSTVSSGQNSEKKRGNVATLTPWKPGQSGNPSGRPRRPATILSSAYAALLMSPFEGDPQGRTWAEMIARSQAEAAQIGSTQAAIEIRKATEGDKINVGMNDTLKLVAHELGLTADAIRTDPILSAIFTTAGIDFSGDGEDEADSAGA